jgi:hypothetical protein
MYAPAAKAACLKRPKFCFPVPNPSITARLSVASLPCATLTGSPRGNDTQPKRKLQRPNPAIGEHHYFLTSRSFTIPGGASGSRGCSRSPQADLPFVEFVEGGGLRAALLRVRTVTGVTAPRERLC